MMKLRLSIMIILVGVVPCMAAKSLPLPVWSKQDRAKLIKGELVVGAGLFNDSPAFEPPKSEVPIPEVPPIEPEPYYDPEIIPEGELEGYFASTYGEYLIDPQKLLTRQEVLDQEGFLQYHASESELDIKMYLFDARQKLPASHDIARICKQVYAGQPLTAVVFCFLGNPDRNQIAFAGEGADQISKLELRKMRESAVIKAMQKSDPVMQLDSFAVQFSISLYWLEREQEKSRALAAIEEKKRNLEKTAEGIPVDEPVNVVSDRDGVAMIKTYAVYLLAGVLGLVCVAAMVWLSWSAWKRSRRYDFPVYELPRRLGGDYAAGVGAVIAFHSKLSSPSSQRNEASDYLTRI